MNQRVPSWDLEDVHPNHDIYKLGYEVAELTWENGQVALHELASRRVPTKSQPTASWENPRAAETLEAVVNQATLQPYHKTDISVNDGELVPWVNPHNPTVNIGNLNQSAAMTSDAMVPNSNNRIGEGSAQGQPSVKSVGSCSGRPSAFMVAGGGGGGDIGALVTADVYGGDLGGRRVMSTSMGSPENTSSGRDCSNSTFHDHTASHRGTQRETKVNEKKKENAKSSISTKRRRTAAIHNQSERKRRDKINQKLKTLQKLVPNSSKTDKASMLDEVIEHIKQLQLQLNTRNMMNMSPMMISLMMQHQYQQQQLEVHKSLMNPMGMGMGMGMGGMGMNTIGPSNINLARFHPSAFMPMPSWNNHITDQVANTNTMAGGPMSTFLAPQSQLPNMDSYSRMAALYQQMQHQPCGPFPKN